VIAAATLNSLAHISALFHFEAGAAKVVEQDQ